MNVDTVTVLQCRCLPHLFMKIRNKETSRRDFVTYSKRLMRVICEEGIACLNPSTVDIVTPTQSVVTGPEIDVASIVVVSIIRAGDSMLESFLECCPEAAVGKILIQRDEATAQPALFYSKLPPLQDKIVVIVDPMLATGGSAACAIDVLLKNGASARNLFFFNVVACPEGVTFLTTKYPDVRIITGCIDDGLNAKKYIVPGLGDYGDRFFGTI